MQTKTKVSTLMNDLRSTNGTIRVNARKSLILRGNDALLPLMLLLQTGTYWERWEAAMALQEMKNPLSIKTLVKALRDEKFEIRWLAAEGLINIGESALKPLGEALIEDPDSVLLQQGGHHVLKGLSASMRSDAITRLIEAIESITPSLDIPFAASALLESLR